MGSRTVICEDATVFIKKENGFQSVVTSLPDAEETNMDLSVWQKWFTECVSELVLKTKEYAIFYQTDRKINGELISKANLVFKGIERAGGKILFHKIILRRGVGKIDLFRPGFTHLICATKTGKPGKSTPDVIERGQMIYDNAMGLNAVRAALEFIRTNGKQTDVITDPFCGRGTILAAANKMGFNSVGCDIDEEQCKKARLLKFK